MLEKPFQIFFDANVIIEAGKPPGGPFFARTVDLVKCGFITVLTTDLTKTEVAKKHTENDYKVIKEMGRPHFRKIAKEVLDVDIPDTSKAKINEAISKKYASEVEEMFAALVASTLSIDSVRPSVVFASYAEERGFFSGDGKKDQFPDAFIFECLKCRASEETPVIIVSNDGDFDHPCKSEKHISVIKSIPDLFKMLGLVVESPNINKFLEDNHQIVVDLVNDELNNWGLQASDVEDAYIEEVSVTEIELVDITSFGKAAKGDEILVIGVVKVTADISYTHPDWDNAAYDSEDKVLIPFDEVSGQTEIELQADFSMSILVDDTGNPAEIEEIRFTNDEFVWVEINRYDPWEYK